VGQIRQRRATPESLLCKLILTPGPQVTAVTSTRTRPVAQLPAMRRQ
jgi:hypothetical protein